MKLFINREAWSQSCYIFLMIILFIIIIRIYLLIIISYIIFL